MQFINRSDVLISNNRPYFRKFGLPTVTAAVRMILLLSVKVQSIVVIFEYLFIPSQSQFDCKPIVLLYHAISSN